MAHRPLVAAIAGEAWANCRRALMRSVILGLAVTICVGALSWTELAGSHQLIEEAHAREQAGERIVVVNKDGGVSGPLCEAVGRQQGIRAAGALRNAGTVIVASAGGTGVQRTEVTSGLLSVWQEPGLITRPDPEGAVVGDDAAAEFGVAAGAYLLVDGTDAPVRITGVLPTNRRSAVAGRAWLDVVPSVRTDFDQCWVEFTAPGDTAERSGWLLTVFGRPGDGFTAAPFVRDALPGRSLAERFDDRASRNAWIVGGIVLLAVQAMMVRGRRAGLALYAITGWSRSAIAAILFLELLITGVIGLYAGGIAALTAYVVQHEEFPSADQLAVAGVAGSSAVLVVLGLGWAFALLISERTLLAQLRDR
jgi:nitroreductase